MKQSNFKSHEVFVDAAAGACSEGLLALARLSPADADTVYGTIKQLERLVPLSAVMQDVLAKVDAMRREA